MKNKLLTKTEPGPDILLCTLPNNMDKVMGLGKRYISPIEPLGLMYIAANVRKHGFSVAIMDAFAMGYGFSEIVSEIKRLEPRVIGFSLLTSQAYLYVELAKILRKEFPRLNIIIGNIHASIYFDYFLNNNLCDYAVHGEGEFITIELLRAIKNKSKVFAKGVSYKKGGQIVNTGIAEVIKDLNDLPSPAWDLVHMNLYKLQFYVDPIAGNPKYFAQMVSSRGCTNLCKFCSVHFNRRLRYFSAERVLGDIDTLYNTYGVRFIAFHEANLTSNMDRLDAICRGLIKRKYNLKWGCDTRADQVTRRSEILKLMKDAGCEYVCYGIESGSQKVLDKCRKGLKLSEVKYAVKLAKKEKLKVQGLFILGLPGETTETCGKTIDLACGLDLDLAQFSIFTPFPGSEYYNELLKNKEIDPYAWNEYVQYASLAKDKLPVYAPKGITKEQLVEIQKKALRMFYLRPRIIIKFLFKIRLYNIIDYFVSAIFLFRR